MDAARTFSIVVSVFNEEDGLGSFWASLSAVLGAAKDRRFEVVWVNDGSRDASERRIEALMAAAGPANVRHQLISFSRNFGHEAAMIAGIDHATGDAVICMDADEQHPPDRIPAMVEASCSGADIVLMERSMRADNGPLKNLLSKLFYDLLNRLSVFRFQENSTDFFLITRPVVEVMRRDFRERTRFLRGFIQTVGFERVVLSFEAPARAHGTSSYSMRRLALLGMDAVFAFSNKPLRLAVLFSLVFVGFTVLFSGYSLYQFLTRDTVPSGYTTIVIFLSVSFSLLFITLTIFTLYFEKVIQEMRKRPIYIIRRREGPEPW